MVASASWGGIAKIKAPELKTEKVFADAFSALGKTKTAGSEESAVLFITFTEF